MDAEADEPLKSWITNQSDGLTSRWRLAASSWPKPKENCSLRRLITARMKAIVRTMLWRESSTLNRNLVTELC